MHEPLWQIWKYAFCETVRRMFGHEYGCCDKWWKSAEGANMTDKITCPWCGAEMEIKTVHHDVPGIIYARRAKKREQRWNAWTSCTNDDCGADGPIAVEMESEQEAIDAVRAAALRRYTPPILCETCGEFGWDLPQCRNTDGTKYGRKECKYWSRKPTDEERSAAEWEN